MVNQEKRPSLLTNALSNWTALAITVVVGLFLTPYIIGYLGKTGYGIWVLISSIIGYYGILDLGVTSAITRYVARYAGQKDYKSLNGTINTSLVMFCVIGFIVVVASFALAGPMSSFFNVSTDQIVKFRQTVWLLGLAVGVGFLGNLFGAVIKAHERFVAANLVIIFITLIRTSLIVLLLSRGFGLVGVACSHLLTTIFMIILNFALCKLLFSHFELQLRSARWNILRTLLGFGAATSVASIAGIMRFNLDSFVIGKWINIPAIAVYGVAALLIRFFMQFIGSGTVTVLTPRFSALDGEGDKTQLQKLFLKSLSVAAFLSFGVGTLIIILGRRFIVLWVGAEFLEAVPVLLVLTVSYSIALAQTPGISLVYALKKHHLFAGACVVEGIANVVLSIYLAPRYGILGVAIGTAAPMLVIKLFVQPIYVSRIIGISLMRYWSQLLPALGLAMGVFMVGRYAPSIKFIGNGYISLAAYSLSYAGIFLLGYVLVNIITGQKDIQESANQA
ncbi:oligosaccharide flippase family protein [Planctomycetota bacterium]